MFECHIKTSSGSGAVVAINFISAHAILIVCTSDSKRKHAARAESWVVRWWKFGNIIFNWFPLFKVIDLSFIYTVWSIQSICWWKRETWQRRWRWNTVSQPMSRVVLEIINVYCNDFGPNKNEIRFIYFIIEILGLRNTVVLRIHAFGFPIEENQIEGNDMKSRRQRLLARRVSEYEWQWMTEYFPSRQPCFGWVVLQIFVCLCHMGAMVSDKRHRRRWRWRIRRWRRQKQNKTLSIENCLRILVNFLYTSTHRS